METKRRNSQTTRIGRAAFTLVELLVVITIIGILAALITAAAAGAMKSAQRTRIKTEMDQIDMALHTFKDTYQSFPPNCQVDDNNETGAESATTPLVESQVLTDLKRQMKQAFPRHRESENLLRALVGLAATGTDSANYQKLLPGGMSAGEAIVFWLGGFSSDPKYPISGEGGPAYEIPGVGQSGNYKLDPIDTRKWVFPFQVTRLEPRDTDKYFNQGDNRYIEYVAVINGKQEPRRINFWQYVPPKSEKPYLYFDTSRHPATADFDPPAATTASATALDVHAIKQRSEVEQANVSIEFCNRDKFQILHAGIDDEWGDFEKMSLAHTTDPKELLLYPDGPFTGEVADTIVNFSDRTTLEASQP